MMSSARLLGFGELPPDHPPIHPPIPMPVPMPVYQPPIYVERQTSTMLGSPCRWFEDPVVIGDDYYCRAPAIWLVIAAVGASSIFMMTRKKS